MFLLLIDICLILIFHSSDSVQQCLGLKMRGQLLMVVLLALGGMVVTTSLKMMEIWEEVQNACDYNCWQRLKRMQRLILYMVSLTKR